MHRSFCNKIKLLLLLFLFINLKTIGQGIEKEADKNMQFWVDSVYNSLTLNERVGQLIFARANLPNQGFIKEVDAYVKNYNLGGIVYFACDPVDLAIQTNRLNQLAKTPLLISIDAEWGLGMRLRRTISYPMQMTLGALTDDDLIYQMGLQIGRQCNRLGIQINFAPVADINSNSGNPVIGMRSFGENSLLVSRKALAYMNGLQKQGIIASAKHFPGHGDTKTDSHFTLPLVNTPLEVLEKNELVPFQYLIDNGISSVMVAHLSIPSMDTSTKRASSLSPFVVERQLNQKMGFRGLVITDGLDMKGVTIDNQKGEVALKALIAGNDVLLIPEDIPASVNAIVQAVVNGRVPMERVEESCKKILTYKYLSGAWLGKNIDTTNLINDLNKPADIETMKTLFNEAITLVKNEKNLIPVSYPDTLRLALIIIGTKAETEFEKTFKQFMPVTVFHITHDALPAEKQQIISQLSKFNLAVVAVVNTNILAAKRYGISESDVQFIEYVARNKPLILDIFASPYSLNLFSSFAHISTLLVSYQDKPYVQQSSAEIILGMQQAVGILPVSAGGFFAGQGIVTAKQRLTYASPAELGIDSILLKKVDSIALKGIELKAYPGCQIIAAKDGFIFYDKTFGFHTYENIDSVTKNDVYDLASLTKIMATLPSIMMLVDQKKININGKISDYLFYLKGTNKENLGFREVLAHQSGLETWIPYYKNTVLKNSWDTTYYRSIITEQFPVRVAQNMYIRENYTYDIYREIIQSPLKEKKYAYSDLGFYLMKDLIEKMTNSPLDQFVYTNFYGPLGLDYLRFHPRRYFPLNEVVPTENDVVFRHQLLQGDVHDQGAAMMGGVSGHAGLFGNAHDVAVIMQMFLNGGSYGGRSYLKPETIMEFTSYQFPANNNRRGLGFDKPLLDFKDHSSNCSSASPSSFGHSGFTGTYAWADPETGLVFVFLSNRVNPDAENKNLSKYDIRINIHQLFYDAMNAGAKHEKKK